MTGEGPPDWAISAFLFMPSVIARAGGIDSGNSSPYDPYMKIEETRFGTTPDGRAVRRFTLVGAGGMRVSAISWGATLTEVAVPDRTGKTANVTLGYGSLEEYRDGKSFFGCLVGRFANRISGGRFLLDGAAYELARNDGANHLHGGLRGFDKALWDAKPFRRGDSVGIRWTLTSRGGEEGYPGRLHVTAEYALSEGNELSFEYWAITDRPTPVNLTNHSYWNLAGSGVGTVLDHEASFRCPFYLPSDAALTPTGEVRSVAGTPFDFSKAKPIGRDIASVAGGYDHCMVIGKPADVLGPAATVRDPAGGRVMEVWTTAPGIQFYTGNFLDGKPFPKHGGFCLETQHFPDCVNIGHFPSCILRPGRTYHQRTVHKFSA